MQVARELSSLSRSGSEAWFGPHGGSRVCGLLSPLKAVWDGGAVQDELEGGSGGENDVFVLTVSPMIYLTHAHFVLLFRE